jgi:NNP family nitrate/nitrite transporter-like MFS transporter
MVIPGAALFLMGFVYYFFTQDTPSGNFRQREVETTGSDEKKVSFWIACRDYRIWMLFLAYGACFGIEITIDNIATLYFIDNFNLGLREAGIIAGSFGMMNLFARALGGVFGDKMGNRFGLRGRIIVLSVFLFLEGIGVILFSKIDVLPWAIFAMLGFALFLKMANGATYSVVPFINKKAIGTVSGIVGAGGNVGAVLAGLLFASDKLDYRESFQIIGVTVVVVGAISFLMALPKISAAQVLPPDFQDKQAFATISSDNKNNG